MSYGAIAHSRSIMAVAGDRSSSKAKLSTVDSQEPDRLEFHYSNCVSKLWTLSRLCALCPALELNIIDARPVKLVVSTDWLLIA